MYYVWQARHRVRQRQPTPRCLSMKIQMLEKKQLCFKRFENDWMLLVETKLTEE